MTEEISLTVAAFRLGMSYERAKRLLLSGVLSGRQENGKWIVYADSVTAYQKTPASPATLGVSERPVFSAKFEGWCPICHTVIDVGDGVCYDDDKNLVHSGCMREDDDE